MRKLPLSQWGAVRVSLFCFKFSLGRLRRLDAPPQKDSTQRPPTAPCLFLKSPFFASNSLWGGAPRRVATFVLGRSLSFSAAHAAAIPLPFDALPRRVTPKFAGYIVSQWGAMTALGF